MFFFKVIDEKITGDQKKYAYNSRLFIHIDIFFIMLMIEGTNFQANIKLSNHLVHMYMCYMAGGRALYNF